MMRPLGGLRAARRGPASPTAARRSAQMSRVGLEKGKAGEGERGAGGGPVRRRVPSSRLFARPCVSSPRLLPLVPGLQPMARRREPPRPEAGLERAACRACALPPAPSREEEEVEEEAAQGERAASWSGERE